MHICKFWFSDVKYCLVTFYKNLKEIKANNGRLPVGMADFPYIPKILSEYGQVIPQSQTADKPVAS